MMIALHRVACMWHFRLGLSLVTISIASLLAAEPVAVLIQQGEGILRGGERYFVKGAAGDQHLDDLVAAGGNSIRTWTTNGLDELLDAAHRRNLTVCAGIWLEPECSWFSYSNAEHCERQEARVVREVTAHRHHPALLFWGLGNEVEGEGTNTAYWKQLEVLAKAVKSLDPAHPTFTAVAGLQPAKIKGLNKHTPSLDFVGINTYGALMGLRGYLKKHDWERPWVVTEYGPRGFWESPRTAWRAPVEVTSGAKADFIRQAYTAAILPGGDCWGSYIFLWGQKQEATSTWFGIYTDHGESTAVKDVLQELWTGRPPAERAPDITSLSSEVARKEIQPGQEFQASASAMDPDGDALQWHWTLTAEHAGRDRQGRERVPPHLPDCVVTTEGATATFRAPSQPGHYRVHLRVTDTRRRAATANFPFSVAAP
jgi:hypothetical protein